MEIKNIKLYRLVFAGCGILLGICLSLVIFYNNSCTNNKETSADDVEYIDDEMLFMDDDWAPSAGDYANSVKGHKEVDVICGTFLIGRTDTLHLEDETQTEYTFNVVSSNPNIPVIKLENTLCPLLVNEGDLDGNGTTEVGVLDTWHTSSCRLYRIYTLKDNKWCYLIAPLETSESVRASGMELAEPTGIKNKIRVRYADFEAPLSSCASSPVKDTIVTAIFLPIDDY